MQEEAGPARHQRRRVPESYFERDLAAVRDRPPPERDEPERLDPDREPLARVDAALRDELEPDAREREELEPEDARERDELARERDAALLERPFELLDLRRRLLEERRVPPLRSAAGTSSRATAFASCSICRSRNFAIRSSSRRMVRAILAVSLSPTRSAKDSIVL
jgi:hypothetical protein